MSSDVHAAPGGSDGGDVVDGFCEPGVSGMSGVSGSDGAMVRYNLLAEVTPRSPSVAVVLAGVPPNASTSCDIVVPVSAATAAVTSAMVLDALAGTRRLLPNSALSESGSTTVTRCQAGAAGSDGGGDGGSKGGMGGGDGKNVTVKPEACTSGRRSTSISVIVSTEMSLRLASGGGKHVSIDARTEHKERSAWRRKAVRACSEWLL